MIKFNKDYVRCMKKRGQARGRFLNASFAEWLFGFPANYTNPHISLPCPNPVRSPGRFPVASLFSGLDGLSLELEEWLDVKLRVDTNPFARSVLAAREKDGFLQESELREDVRFVMASQLHALGVKGLVAGWPCQGNSVAGHQMGLEDARTGLFEHILRLTRDTPLDMLFLENVAGLMGKNMIQDTLNSNARNGALIGIAQ